VRVRFPPPASRPTSRLLLLVGVLHSVDGHHPALTQSLRVTTITGLLSLSAEIVARPVAVTPMISVPSLFQRKCSSHRCSRGLNNATTSDASGSTAWVCLPLASLQRRHDNHRLFSVVLPPNASGRRCSNSAFRSALHYTDNSHTENVPAHESFSSTQ